MKGDVKDDIAQAVDDYIGAQTRDLDDEAYLDVLEDIESRVKTMIAAKEQEMGR